MASQFSPLGNRIVVGLFTGLFRILGGYHVRGLENIPKTGGCILAPNHLSWADPPAVRMCIPRRGWFMANDFLFNIPVLGKLIPKFGAFSVKRGVMDRDALKQAEGYLKGGDLLCVFPEGGTSETGRLVPFEGGVSLLALRNDVPIVPVGLSGTDRVMPRDPTFPRYAKGGITVTYGKAIYPSEIDPTLPRRERMDELTERLYWAVNELLPPNYRAKEDEPKGADRDERPEKAPAPTVPA
jgi:1-acyl-sn-glycerol-3-phosphate acyltransferase